MHSRIVILGAGLAGLSAAYHLKNRDYSIFEKEDSPGGLCRSINLDGYTFDYDGHLLHFRNAYTKRLIKDLLGNSLVKKKRSSWIRIGDSYILYPFQIHFDKLPKKISKDCLSGIKKICPKKHYSHFQDWCLSNFGEGIYKHFLKPYNEKFWTVPCTRLTHDWTQNFFPKVDLKKPSYKGGNGIGYNAEFYYPKQGGIENLVKVIVKNLKKHIHTNHKVKHINLKDKHIEFQNKAKCNYDYLISTIPLPELISIIPDLPRNIKSAISTLRYNSIYVLNLGIDRPNISDKHWIYFPERKYIFYRVGFPMNFSLGVAPAGKSSLYVEISFSSSNGLDRRGIKGRVISDLAKAEILNREDKIDVFNELFIRYAYPIYDRNHICIGKILSFLKHNNIYPIGRYGTWRYMSMEDAILDGKCLAGSFI